MKKLLTLLIAGLFVMGTVVGCGTKPPEKPTTPAEEETEEEKKTGEEKPAADKPEAGKAATE